MHQSCSCSYLLCAAEVHVGGQAHVKCGFLILLLNAKLLFQLAAYFWMHIVNVTENGSYSRVLYKKACTILPLYDHNTFG